MNLQLEYFPACVASVLLFACSAPKLNLATTLEFLRSLNSGGGTHVLEPYPDVLHQTQEAPA